MGQRVQDVMRAALRNYMEEREWLRIIRYERLPARHADQEDSRRTT